MSAAQELTKESFDSKVSAGVTLVDFWAEWCGPCKMMNPTLDQIAKDYAGKASVAKVNIDYEADLAMRYEVSSIPTLLVIKDGEVKKRFVGVTSKTDLSAAIDTVLA
ncbi:MAG: thioredoxin [Candidatus Hydrogenedentota bacterium]